MARTRLTRLNESTRTAESAVKKGSGDREYHLKKWAGQQSASSGGALAPHEDKKPDLKRYLE